MTRVVSSPKYLKFHSICTEDATCTNTCQCCPDSGVDKWEIPVVNHKIKQAMLVDEPNQTTRVFLPKHLQITKATNQIQ